MKKIIVNKDADFFKEIGDRFFKVKSLKEVVDSLIKKNDDKAFYNYLIKNLKEQGIEENVFVQKVCEMIYRKEDMSKLLTFLQKNISKIKILNDYFGKNPMKPPTSLDFPLFIHSGLFPCLSRHRPCNAQCYRA